jgi:hypothetical protein
MFSSIGSTSEYHTVGVELLDPDVVEVAAPVHRGERPRLGEVEQPRLEDLVTHIGGHRGKPVRPRRCDVVAQDPEPGTWHRAEKPALVVLLELVLTVAEERERPGRQPAQELRRLGTVGVTGRPGELAGERGGPVEHLRPVGNCRRDVGEHADQVLADSVEHGPIGLAVDLDAQVGLHDHAVVRRLRRGRIGQDLEQRTVAAPTHREHRVHHQMQAEPAAPQLHRDRVDKEPHVVGDDLDDGVRGGVAVLVDVRRVHRHPGLARPSSPRESQVGQRGAVKVRDRARGEVAGVDAVKIRADEGEEEPRTVAL